MSFPYRMGRKPALMPVGLRELGYYVAGPLPKAPASVGCPPAPQGVADETGPWGCLGNDQYGDCGVAGLTHLLEADAAITTENEAWPSAAQVVDYYLAYTEGQDSGVVLSQFLGYVRQHGFFQHTVSAFAPVNVHDVPTLQTAVYLYDGAYCGIGVTASMQQAFQEGEPWDYSVTADPVIGGHCVPVIGYDDHYIYLVTWARVQAVTWPAWHSVASEAWCIISGEFVARNGDGRGVNLEALRQDLDRLAV